MLAAMSVPLLVVAVAPIRVLTAVPARLMAESVPWRAEIKLSSPFTMLALTLEPAFEKVLLPLMALWTAVANAPAV